MLTDRHYFVTCEKSSAEEVLLQLRWGEPAENDRLVVDAVAAIRELKLVGGRLVKFDGPASLPIAMALSHEVAHLFGAVAVKDPKLGKFVVVISHTPDIRVGNLID